MSNCDSASADKAAYNVAMSSKSGLKEVSVKLLQDLEQGTFITGFVPVGSVVKLGKRTLPITDKGEFAFAIGRNAKPKLSLVIGFPDGTSKTHEFDVKKRDWEIQRINGLPKKHVTPSDEQYKRIKKENALIISARTKSDNVPYFGFKNFVQPAEGIVSGVFGSQRILNGKPRSPHSGIDFAAPKGAPVVASADGVVSLVHDDMFYTGKTVMLDHGYGLATIYLHMSQINVKQGDKVKQGFKLGEVGMTGRSTGPHLHWGATWYGVKFDPLKLLDYK
ncbi:MAG: M23 family metallopeptidase [Alphaproteobacteria bacterium]|nr:M23 family metallopeptidase [Alphaproteobacteria bacterium]